jgi:hypothetical protein
MRVVAVDFADKSHAWNLYMHALRPLAETHVFVDGYALVTPDAFTDLAGTLARTGADAAAAMPVSGRSAALQRAVMREHGGLMGALHALSGSFVERIAAAGLRLPLGLYRGDGLVGSMVVHDLDAHGPWEPARIAVAHRATWHQPETSLWSLRDLRRHANRKVQQARGRLEDAAIRSIIYRQGYAGLPRFADQMVLDWLAEDPARRPSRTDLAGQVALRRLRLRRTPFGAELAPRRLVDTVGTSRSFA